MKKVLLCALLSICALAIAAEVIPPQPIQQSQPVYTQAILDKKLSGSVVVEFVVDTDGTVKDAVAKQSPAPELSEAAVACVMQWKFKPGTADKKPVRHRTAVTILFARK